MSESFNERLRLIRFRRKRERSTFREELRIIPKWLVWLCIALYIVGLIIGLAINLHNFQTGDPIFPDESVRQSPLLSCFYLVIMITLLAITGLTHRQSYGDIFAITCIKTTAVFVVIAVYYVTGIV